MRLKLKWLAVAIIPLLLLLSGHASAITATCQNHPPESNHLYRSLDDPDEEYGVYFDGSGAGRARNINNYYANWGVYPGNYEYTNFLVKDVRIVFYDENHTEITRTENLSDYMTSGQWHLCEVERSLSGNVRLYVNGADKGIVASCSQTPYYIGVYYYAKAETSTNDERTVSRTIAMNGTNESSDRWAVLIKPTFASKAAEIAADDFISITSRTEAIVETMPHDWYILRDWDEPEKSGVYRSDDVRVSGNFTISYVVPYLVEMCDEIRIIHYDTGLVVKTIALSDRWGTIELNVSSLLFHDDPHDDKYGLYLVELVRDGKTIDFDYFYYTYHAKEGHGFIRWDKEVYYSDETARIIVNLTSPDFSNYTYMAWVYDDEGRRIKEWVLQETDSLLELDLSDYTSGTYLAVLHIREEASGEEWDEDYDIAVIWEYVLVEGTCYDAKNSTALSGVYVEFWQIKKKYTTMSDSEGRYEIGKLISGEEISVGAAKEGYKHNNFTFTPVVPGRYNIDLYLIPEDLGAGSIIAGLVLDEDLKQAFANATVLIWNETWNSSTTTNDCGYFEFELSHNETTTYYLQAFVSETEGTDVYEVSIGVNETKTVILYATRLYTLTVFAKDAETRTYIEDFSARIDSGTWKRASNMSVVFQVRYGIHKLDVSADGYYPHSVYVGVVGDRNYTAYLYRYEEGGTGAGVSYPPHQVEFVCVDLFNNPLPGIYVEATPLATSVGRWEWLLSLFGLRNESLSYYRNQTINGTTDDRGAVVFLMMENVEYEIRFVNESLGIDKTMRIYPKGDYYYVVVLTPSTPSVISSEDYISFNLSYELVDGGENIKLALEYHDELNQTQNLTFFVYNSSNALLCQQNFTAPNASHVVANCTVPYEAGEEYLWGFSAFHSKFGEVGRSRLLRIKWFLDLGIPREFCTWIAVAILLFLTGMFSFVTAKFGYVVVPLFGLFFAYIGWLPNTGVIVVALCLGVLAYMSKREKEVGL